MLRFPMGMGMTPELEVTDFIMPNNFFSIKHALKLVPGFADVGPYSFLATYLAWNFIEIFSWRLSMISIDCLPASKY